jgi:hypothetical protein
MLAPTMITVAKPGVPERYPVGLLNEQKEFAKC